MTDTLIPLGKWVDRGACKGADQENFFPGRGNSITAYARAKAFCDRCPVITECAEYALQFDIHDLVGMWGGMTAKDRADIRRAREQLAS